MLNGNNELKIRQCFVCENEKSKPMVKVPYLFPFYSKEEIYNHTLVKCLSCGNYYINPTVSDHILDKYYATQTSYEINDTQTTILNSYEFKSLQQKKFIQKYINVQNMTLLDFGCATAYTLNQFKNYNNKLIGFDTSKECSIIAKEKYGIEVFVDYIAITKFEYDLVMLSHVLEHLSDPIGVLSSLSKLMKKETYIYIEVPYIESFQELNDDEIFGHISFEHLNYFNKTNLSNLMNKVGFKEVKIEIASNDDGTMPNYPVILSLWQLTDEKEINFKNSSSSSFEQYLESERSKLNKFQGIIKEKVGDKKIIIYGTGTHTYRLLAMCPNIKENIIGFSDGNTKKYTEESFFDLPCRAIENFDEYDAILISSKASEDEIYDLLKIKTNKEIIKIYG